MKRMVKEEQKKRTKEIGGCKVLVPQQKQRFEKN